ncbi:MAG TPA: heterodisulfide reductase-related iron-sulfur binding cluster [Stellaceae bacterium]|jgi:glycerol-3-phosphate dehydrogenase subunit C|nr:heterodisulfide reductase-related iron-sulfur binding cluster [Stellaceae bacterium]
MREGSLEAPTRHVIDWENPDYSDRAKTEAEMERVFDICHTCRRCFNLCDSFPRLFDLIDESATGELDGVAKTDYKKVADACTLCDMCFMTKCPYVPPHEFNVDFPHLMLRYRAVEAQEGRVPLAQRQLTHTDRNGKLAGKIAPIANWGSDRHNTLTRPLLEKVAGIDRNAALPKFHGRTFAMRAKRSPPPVNRDAPNFGRKAVLYATCFANYNNPGIGEAAQAVLAKNGVETEVVYPQCCGMPQLESGNLAAVAAAAKNVAGTLAPWIDKGYDVVALVPSCALMLKFEWPLIVPNHEAITKLSKSTYDISEYIVALSKEKGLTPGLGALEGGVTLHIACHARAQNVGQKAAEMLRLVPDTEIKVIERCSGHGGSWGVMKENFATAIKVGRPVARQALNDKQAHIASECPLAGLHIAQGMELMAKGAPAPSLPAHPIELFARAYGIAVDGDANTER